MLVAVALAGPAGSPVAIVDHGVVGLSAAMSGNGEVFRPSALGARVDVVPTDGLGLYLDVDRIDARASGASRDRGWQSGVGVHGAYWLADGVGLGITARGGFGRDWTVDGGVRSAEVARFSTAVSPALVVGRQGGGAYAWLGPEVTAIARVRTAVTGGGLEWPEPPVHLGAIVGGHLVSEDLVGLGREGRSFVSVGSSLRVGSSWGLAVWVGVAR